MSYSNIISSNLSASSKAKFKLINDFDQTKKINYT